MKPGRTVLSRSQTSSASNPVAFRERSRIRENISCNSDTRSITARSPSLAPSRFPVLGVLVPAQVVRGVRSSPRPFGGAHLRLSLSLRGRGWTILLARSRGCGRGWAGISARRLRCSSVAPPDVVPSVSDRGRRIPTGPAPKNKQNAPQRGAGNCAKDENRPAPEERPEGAASRGAGNCAKHRATAQGEVRPAQETSKARAKATPRTRTGTGIRPGGAPCAGGG